jgi:hypothetical protein
MARATHSRLSDDCPPAYIRQRNARPQVSPLSNFRIDREIAKASRFEKNFHEAIGARDQSSESILWQLLLEPVHHCMNVGLLNELAGFCILGIFRKTNLAFDPLQRV